MNFTLGQFYPTNSYIHNLDPRLKLISTFLLATMLFFSNNFLAYSIGFVFLIFVIYLSKINPIFALKNLKNIWFIVTITFIINCFFYSSKDPSYYSFYFLKISKEGLIFATNVSLRLVLLVMISSLLTLTTSPLQLSNAIEVLLTPFKKIGVPSHEIAMMMTITLRFIPTLSEELDKIIKAQTARGADFYQGNIIKKSKALIPVLVPLFISSFRRAEDLATAMESRCYRGDINRTKMNNLKFKKNDYYALISIISICVIILSTIFK